LVAWVTLGPLGHLYGVGADVLEYGTRHLLGVLLARVRGARADVRARLRARGARS
jgi:hypothetical protein